MARGIYAQTDGAGSITITAAGEVTGMAGGAIEARNAGTGALSITSASVTSVSGKGIYAQISDATSASAIIVARSRAR